VDYDKVLPALKKYAELNPSGLGMWTMPPCGQSHDVQIFGGPEDSNLLKHTRFQLQGLGHELSQNLKIPQYLPILRPKNLQKLLQQSKEKHLVTDSQGSSVQTLVPCLVAG